MDGFAIIAHSTPTLYFLASGLPHPSSEVREAEQEINASIERGKDGEVVRLSGEGNTNDKTAKSLVGSYLSSRLRYKSHQESQDGDVHRLSIHSEDERAGISVIAHLSVYRDVPVLRSVVTIINESKSSDVIVTQISSLTIGGLTTSSNEWNKDYVLRTPTNSWFREAQWRKHSLPDIGIDKNGICELPDGHSGSQATFSLQNRGQGSEPLHPLHFGTK
ncbi:hypothetical protein FOQG_11975 [Fusarium oxysporum f. sp. raphani 54005]|uniref:Glycosyl hydrolase family 36 N-terminal domain-containing protein n=1 Tax=Fusarium oxysporum f. sp. raphani 54005 TaxID=1089458 RepID=X0BNR1_FUSOX|nr:hypothetical protein FOQG_11975 [Fusarium oxysporum f. sp. raphani 54005]